MIFSKFVVYNSKKSKFIRQQEASGLLSGLGIKTPLNEIPLVRHHAFITSLFCSY